MFWRTAALMLICLLAPVGAGFVRAQDATPQASGVGEPHTMVRVEHAIHRTTVDLGTPGPSIGDMLIWGPNPLYDEANVTDTGATDTGTCVWFDTAGDCLFYESIVFPDGSTMQTQGIQPAAAVPSEQVIIGGSGKYRGVTGVIHIVPSDDFRTWTRTFEIWDAAPADQ